MHRTQQKEGGKFYIAKQEISLGTIMQMLEYLFIMKLFIKDVIILFLKSRIRETKNLSTDMESSNDNKKLLLSRTKLAQAGQEGGKIRPGRGGREEGKICPKTNFFCEAISHPLFEKVLKSETTSFHYFSPRIPNL